MLLTVQGYFERGHFVADTPVQIPERRKTIVTVLDEKVEKENDGEKYIDYWNKIIEDIQNCDEVLEGEPERIRFRTPEEIDAL
jgi:glycerol-3-phosphate cytidylyltransferase-like family protein